MSKSEGQKMKLFALKDILEQETDANHGIPMKRILQLLEDRGIKAERKSIYDDLRAFRDSEILDVTEAQGQNREYSVVSRDFDSDEVKLLVDAVQASKFLSDAKTKTLVKKLKKLCSRHEAAALQRQVIVTNRVKSMNNKMQYNVDPIHEAIAKNSQITFLYFDYVIGRNFAKERHYMNKKERYTASPWAMIYTDDNYYLLAYHDGKMKHFRVDRMEDVELRTVEQNGLKVVVPREGKEEYDKKDMSTYTNYTFSMYGGEVKNVEMVFLNRMLNTVIDRFGKDVLAYPVDKNHFKITVPVAISQQFFGWVFGLGKYVRIVGPDDVVEKMKKALSDISERYPGEDENE